MYNFSAKSKITIFFVKLTIFSFFLAVPANHCPGSLMFLFETLSRDDEDIIDYRILYTGDFRFENLNAAIHETRVLSGKLILLYFTLTEN